MASLFAVCSLLVMPQILDNRSGTGYSGNHNLDYAEKFSLGNLGYSTVSCDTTPTDLYEQVDGTAMLKIQTECHYGQVGEIYDYGINYGGNVNGPSYNNTNSGTGNLIEPAICVSNE